MSYHIITQPTYFSRTAACGPDCDLECALLEPSTHRQDYALALCGREVVRHRDEYCNAGIARAEWDHDWCIECINSLQWDQSETQTLRGKGILLERPEDINAVGFIASIRQMPPSLRDIAWEIPMQQARLGLLEGVPRPLINWFQEAVSHLDDDGPQPAYWPQDNPWADLP